MANWNDPKVCVLITPTALDTYPDWARVVQEMTEQGKLSQHYIRFGGKQLADVQALAATSPCKWDIIKQTEKYILVRVTFRRPDPPDLVA